MFLSHVPTGIWRLPHKPARLTSWVNKIIQEISNTSLKSSHDPWIYEAPHDSSHKKNSNQGKSPVDLKKNGSSLEHLSFLRELIRSGIRLSLASSECQLRCLCIHRALTSRKVNQRTAEWIAESWNNSLDQGNSLNHPITLPTKMSNWTKATKNPWPAPPFLQNSNYLVNSYGVWLQHLVLTSEKTQSMNR